MSADSHYTHIHHAQEPPNYPIIYHTIPITTTTYNDIFYLPLTPPNYNEIPDDIEAQLFSQKPDNFQEHPHRYNKFDKMPEFLRLNLKLTIPSHIFEYNPILNEYLMVKTTEHHIMIFKYLLQSSIHTHLHSLFVSFILSNPHIATSIYYISRLDNEMEHLIQHLTVSLYQTDLETKKLKKMEKDSKDHVGSVPKTKPTSTITSVHQTPTHSSIPCPKQVVTYNTLQLTLYGSKKTVEKEPVITPKFSGSFINQQSSDAKTINIFPKSRLSLINSSHSNTNSSQQPAKFASKSSTTPTAAAEEYSPPHIANLIFDSPSTEEAYIQTVLYGIMKSTDRQKYKQIAMTHLQLTPGQFITKYLNSANVRTLAQLLFAHYSADYRDPAIVNSYKIYQTSGKTQREEAVSSSYAQLDLLNNFTKSHFTNAMLAAQEATTYAHGTYLAKASATYSPYFNAFLPCTCLVTVFRGGAPQMERLLAQTDDKNDENYEEGFNNSILNNFSLSMSNICYLTSEEYLRDRKRLYGAICADDTDNDDLFDPPLIIESCIEKENIANPPTQFLDHKSAQPMMFAPHMSGIAALETITLDRVDTTQVIDSIVPTQILQQNLNTLQSNDNTPPNHSYNEQNGLQSTSNSTTFHSTSTGGSAPVKTFPASKSSQVSLPPLVDGSLDLHVNFLHVYNPHLNRDETLESLQPDDPSLHDPPKLNTYQSAGINRDVSIDSSLESITEFGNTNSYGNFGLSALSSLNISKNTLNSADDLSPHLKPHETERFGTPQLGDDYNRHNDRSSQIDSNQTHDTVTHIQYHTTVRFSNDTAPHYYDQIDYHFHNGQYSHPNGQPADEDPGLDVYHSMLQYNTVLHNPNQSTQITDQVAQIDSLDELIDDIACEKAGEDTLAPPTHTIVFDNDSLGSDGLFSDISTPRKSLPVLSNHASNTSSTLLDDNLLKPLSSQGSSINPLKSIGTGKRSPVAVPLQSKLTHLTSTKLHSQTLKKAVLASLTKNSLRNAFNSHDFDDSGYIDMEETEISDDLNENAFIMRITTENVDENINTEVHELHDTKASLPSKKSQKSQPIRSSWFSNTKSGGMTHIKTEAVKVEAIHDSLYRDNFQIEMKAESLFAQHSTKTAQKLQQTMRYSSSDEFDSFQSQKNSRRTSTNTRKVIVKKEQSLIEQDKDEDLHYDSEMVIVLDDSDFKMTDSENQFSESTHNNLRQTKSSPKRSMTSKRSTGVLKKVMKRTPKKSVSKSTSKTKLPRNQQSPKETGVVSIILSSDTEDIIQPPPTRCQPPIDGVDALLYDEDEEQSQKDNSIDAIPIPTNLFSPELPQQPEVQFLQQHRMPFQLESYHPILIHNIMPNLTQLSENLYISTHPQQSSVLFEYSFQQLPPNERVTHTKIYPDLYLNSARNVVSESTESELKNRSENLRNPQKSGVLMVNGDDDDVSIVDADDDTSFPFDLTLQMAQEDIYEPIDSDENASRQRINPNNQDNLEGNGDDDNDMFTEPPEMHQVYTTSQDYPVKIEMLVFSPTTPQTLKVQPELVQLCQHSLKRTNTLHHTVYTCPGQEIVTNLSTQSSDHNISPISPYNHPSLRQHMNTQSNSVQMTLEELSGDVIVVPHLRITDPAVIPVLCYWSQLLAIAQK